MAVVNVFSRVSTALWRKQTRVNAVPISLDAPEVEKDKKKLNRILSVFKSLTCQTFRLSKKFKGFPEKTCDF